MRAYELMIIVDVDAGESAVQQVIELVTSWVGDRGGTVPTVDIWGKRRFAYEINHKSEGHYVVLELLAPPTEVSDLERTLRLADPVVRHKLVRLPDEEAERRGLVPADR